jgi:trimethylamine:corrinoid methyltransferase-like protein
LLAQVGVGFPTTGHCPFKKHGVRADGHLVYLSEQVMNAVDKAPARFTLHSRSLSGT